MAKKTRRTTTDTEPPPRPRQRARKDAVAELQEETAQTEQKQQDKGAESFYLLKSEPHEFSIDDLASKKNQTEPWDGVRNYQARNIMRGMKVGERAFFYHSNCKEPGIVGICEVVHEAYPDSTALDPASEKHDPKSTAEDPRWYMVDVKLVRRLGRLVSLQELKKYIDTDLKGMVLLSKGRLSVQPVSAQHWDFILGLEDQVSQEAAK
ncbi:Thymocyte nuclear protein 1 [Coccomyxa sp. Obi]|nr:Thymocyte nuclear protein 1 [Coccomyxa sp. Obi]